MTLPLYSFTGANNNSGDPVGMAQYNAQGQNLVNPGQAQVAAADPISTQAKQGLAQGLGNLLSNQGSQPGISPDAGQNAMAMGAAAQPNSPSGENMGGVGPTVNNLMLAQGLMGQPSAAQMLQSPNNMVNPANNFNNMNYMGGP